MERLADWEYIGRYDPKVRERGFVETLPDYIGRSFPGSSSIMNRLDRDSARSKERTDEERRFLLWSIARANPICSSGPYLNVELPESLESPKNKLDALQNRSVSKPRKRSGDYRRLLIAKSAKVAGTSGLLIGFNIGLLTTLASPATYDMVISMVVPTALCGLLGLAMGWVHVLKKRTDLFGNRYQFYRLCFWQNL